MKLFLTAIGVLAVLFVCLVTGGYYVMETWPIAPDRVTMLKPGMTKAEVCEIVGFEPTRYEGRIAQYNGTMMWTMIYIRYDDDERLKEVEVDR